MQQFENARAKWNPAGEQPQPEIQEVETVAHSLHTADETPLAVVQSPASLSCPKVTVQ